jgi:hypothetical protein
VFVLNATLNQRNSIGILNAINASSARDSNYVKDATNYRGRKIKVYAMLALSKNQITGVISALV